nr:hypothetical protein CFP56_09330 [Quercus suber]
MAICQPLRSTSPIRLLARTYATHATQKELSGKKQFLSLEHFLVRSKVLSLWRDIVRAIHRQSFKFLLIANLDMLKDVRTRHTTVVRTTSRVEDICAHGIRTKSICGRPGTMQARSFRVRWQLGLTSCEHSNISDILFRGGRRNLIA